MCERLRNTLMRGFVSVPLTRRRTRAWRRIRAACGVFGLFIASASYSLFLGRPEPPFFSLAALTGLALLAANDFTLVADALAQVGLRRAQLANVGCHLAHRFLVDAVDVYARAFDR